MASYQDTRWLPNKYFLLFFKKSSTVPTLWVYNSYSACQLSYLYIHTPREKTIQINILSWKPWITQSSYIREASRLRRRLESSRPGDGRDLNHGLRRAIKPGLCAAVETVIRRSKCPTVWIRCLGHTYPIQKGAPPSLLRLWVTHLFQSLTLHWLLPAWSPAATYLGLFGQRRPASRRVTNCTPFEPLLIFPQNTKGADVFIGARVNRGTSINASARLPQNRSDRRMKISG